MDARKRLAFILIGMIVIIPLLNTGCFKKGEDDPFISMYSRKHRMTGTWKRAKVVDSVRVVVGTQNPTLTITEYDASKWSNKIIYVGTDSSKTFTGTVDPVLNYVEYTKFGSFNEVLEYEFIEHIQLNEDGDSKQIRTKVLERNKGTWNFLGKIEDGIKNKERIVMNYLTKEYVETIDSIVILADAEEGAIPQWSNPRYYTVNESFYNGENSEVWSLLGLRNKEVKMEQIVQSSYRATDGTSNNTTIVTETGKKAVTLEKR